MSRDFRRDLPSPGHRARTTMLLVAVTIIAAGVSGAPASFGSSFATPTALTLSIAARPHHPTTLVLVSHLRSSSKRAGRFIAFFVVSTEFKQPMNVPIGTAKTTADGSAKISYTPTWSGEETFVAKLVGSGTHVRAATAHYRVTASTPGPLAATANPGRPLASVGGVFLDVILTVVALVWLSLIIVLAIAFGWMPRLAGEGID